jgi:hypothetical protein
MNTAAAAQSAPDQRGRTPERQTATPSRTWPTKVSPIMSSDRRPNTVSAKLVGRSGRPSMPARKAWPSSGAAKAETPISIRKSELPRTVVAIATSPSRAERPLSSQAESAKAPKLVRIRPMPLPRTCESTYSLVVTNRAQSS